MKTKDHFRLFYTAPEESTDIIAASLFEAECTGIVDVAHNDHYAYFEGEESKKHALSILAEFSITPTVQHLDNKNWNEEWLKSIRPITVSKRFEVVPSWMADEQSKREKIIIDPKMSFGSGHHETTRLCINFLEKHGIGRSTLLDAGTGTAILAIAAEKIGFKKIVAYDNDPETRENGIENLRFNNCKSIRYFVGTVDSLNRKIKFDLICSNIISSVLYSHFSPFAELLNEKGLMIFSGILTKERDEFLQHLANHGLGAIDEDTDGEWLSVVAAKTK